MVCAPSLSSYRVGPPTSNIDRDYEEKRKTNNNIFSVYSFISENMKKRKMSTIQWFFFAFFFFLLFECKIFLWSILGLCVVYINFTYDVYTTLSLITFCIYVQMLGDGKKKKWTSEVKWKSLCLCHRCTFSFADFFFAVCPRRYIRMFLSLVCLTKCIYFVCVL